MHAGVHQPGRTMTLIERLNGPRHELALRVFMVIVLAHWAEHLFQAFRIYALGWPVPESRGALGYFFPWLVKSETLHYGYALVMLAGLWLLRLGFTGVHDHRWWTHRAGHPVLSSHRACAAAGPGALGHEFLRPARCRPASCSFGSLESSCTSSTIRSCSSRWSWRSTFTCFRPDQRTPLRGAPVRGTLIGSLRPCDSRAFLVSRRGLRHGGGVRLPPAFP